MKIIDSSTLLAVVESAQEGEKISAIMRLRTETRCRLDTAKRVVDLLARCQTEPAPASAQAPAWLAGLPPASRNRLLFLCAESRRVEAASLLMTVAELTATEARRCLDELPESLRPAALAEPQWRDVLDTAERAGPTAAADRFCAFSGADAEDGRILIDGLTVLPAPPFVDPSENPALCDAVQRGDLAAAAAHLERHASPDAKCGSGEVLGAAAASGKLQMVDLLLAHGASPSGLADSDRPPLLRAIDGGHDEIARRLLEHGASVGTGPSLAAEEAPLTTLLRRPGEPDPILLDALLAGGSAASAPLLAEVIAAGKMAAARRLVAAGGDINGHCPEHYTPLMAAAQHGDRELVDALLARGARVNVPGPQGNTPLHYAVMDGEHGRAKAFALIEHGANLRARNRDSYNPAALTRKLGDIELAGLLRAMFKESGPQWAREARARGIKLLTLYYDKADGLAFDPNDVECCVLIGGDYDGPRAVTAENALRYLEAGNGRPEAAALVPFLQRIVGGEDFPIDELITACHARITR